jgi:hypothetical protein
LKDAAHTVRAWWKKMRRSLAEVPRLTIAIKPLSSIHRDFPTLVSPRLALCHLRHRLLSSNRPIAPSAPHDIRAYLNSSQPTVSTLIYPPEQRVSQSTFQALAARSLRSLQYTCSGRVSSVAHIISIEHTYSITTPRRQPALEVLQ